ncbi:LacI family DNA-binding transcriptional regulator [Roseibium sp. RKSG952]|uniref:LacI family DNA-binding transcriptional regulator n=1 Tax=Roseibium sp. RKSG952 TaxID=2529384 RepID=UPI0013CDCDC8|nr:LacI family transcriptional regulator [Roseibium sp. RKSG952]
MNLKELSNALGLSQTTVSRALNGYPEVSAKTRARVVEMARKLGYEPNQQAQKLATGRAMAIGHVIPRSVHDMMNPIFLEFIAGAGQTYSGHGYDMILSVVEDAREEEAFREIARKKKADGVILQGPRVQETRHDLLDELGLPYIVHGRISGAEERTSWIDVNNLRAFERATKLLLDLGHRRIALINGRETMDFAARRRAGYEKALADFGLEVDPALISSADMTEPYGAETAYRLLKSKTPPTAFLVASMISAIGVSRAISLAGLKMGQDVSVITHDDALSFLPNSGDMPIFTCTRSSIRQAGMRAAEMILQKVQTPDGPPICERLEAELIIGQSTGPAPSVEGAQKSG